MEWCKDNDIDIEHEHVPEVPAEFCNISMKKIPYPLPMTIKQQHNDHECGSWQFPTELVPKHQKGFSWKQVEIRRSSRRRMGD